MKSNWKSAFATNEAWAGLVTIGFAVMVAAGGCSLNPEQPGRAMYGTAAWSQAWTGACNNIDLSEGPEDDARSPSGHFANIFKGAVYADENSFWPRYAYLDCDLHARAEEWSRDEGRAPSAINEARR